MIGSKYIYYKKITNNVFLIKGFNMRKTKIVLAATILAASTTCANAALISRLGGLAYYDDVNNLTWLADANANGAMTWADANAWAAGLNVAGVTGWRLPDTIDVNNDGITFPNVYQGVDAGYNITTHSEMSNMFYNVLGNSAIFDTAGNPQVGGLSNTGPFTNLQSGYYWSATEYVIDPAYAWVFGMHNGNQGYLFKPATFYDLSNITAWAVYSGDVSAVPVPAAVWLFSSGLLGLVGVARRKR